jgi:pilus assembly protein Flp/PilA
MPEIISGEEIQMNDTMLKLYIKMQNLLSQEEGQDLVEYALVLALISVAAVTATKALATEVIAVFSNVTTTLTNAV